MRKLARTVTACCAIATLPAVTLAAEEAAAPTGPGLTDVLTASGITAHGYVDAGYTYDSGLGNYRAFDTQHNGFDLRQAGLTLAYQPTEGFGGLVNLTAGHDAGLIHSYGGDTGNFDVTQAYVQYATGSWTVMGGKFATLAGAEVINPTANTNVSRSLLFYATEPLTHTGVRAVYAVDSTLSFTFGLNNGWDQLTDLNSQKTLELGMSYAPIKALTLAVQGYYGTEPTEAGGGSRTLIDFVGTYNVTDSLSFVLSYDYFSQGKAALNEEAVGTAKAQGFAGYLNYAIDDQWRMSLRAEYLDDQDGYRTGIKQKLKEETLTFGYAPTKAVELRAELRADQSNADYSFAKPSGDFGKSQYSIELEALVKF